MPRRRKAAKREVLDDYKLRKPNPGQVHEPRDESGKKAAAERIVMARWCQECKNSDLEIFEKKPRRHAPLVSGSRAVWCGATYQVPVEAPPSRRNALAMCWLVRLARKRMRSLWLCVWPANC